MVTILCAFGMIIASILNGFGCASLPHSNLVGKYLKPTTQMSLARVVDDYYYALKSLEEKRWMLVDAMQSAATISPSGSKTRGAMMTLRKICHYTRRHCNDYRLAEKQRVNELRKEINFLENLLGDMRDDIEEMKHSQELALAARTNLGRIRGALGVVFSIILVIRVALAAYSFAFILRTSSYSKTSSFSSLSNSSLSVQRSHQPSDPVTNILLWLIGHDIVNKEQYDLFLQATSLLLAAILSMSQIRAFFRVIRALGRKLSRTFGVSFELGARATSFGEGALDSSQKSKDSSSCVPLLLASFAMGCYFLSCVVVVKMNLPIKYRSSFSSAVGQLDFEFNTIVLNMVFTVSACTTAILLGLLFGIQRKNSERYQLESKLSSFCSAGGASTQMA